jgi:hypothetical protein
MTTHDPTPITLDPSDRRDRLDVLITRITDGCAAPADWQAFTDLAGTDAAPWKALAQAQRDHAALGLAVNLRLHAAERIDLPEPHGARRDLPGHEHRRFGRSRLGSAAGWAVAACVGLAWVGTLRPVVAPAPVAPVQAAGLLSVGTPEDAARAYVQLGRAQNVVLGELPQRLVVDSRPGPDGTIEVTYIRQFVERATTDSLVRFGVDERGRPVPVRVPLHSGSMLTD